MGFDFTGLAFIVTFFFWLALGGLATLIAIMIITFLGLSLKWAFLIYAGFIIVGVIRGCKHERE